jgi:hypothetical protein
MTSTSPQAVSHADARTALTRIGLDSERVDQILADYPDPIDLAIAEPSLFEKYGITEGALMEELGSSP